jgi:hypothetical protein
MAAPPVGQPDLLMARGGAVHYALRRVGLGLPTPVSTLKAGLILSAITWIPVLVISYLDAARGEQVSFLADVSTSARFLVALPLMVAADAVVEPRLVSVARHFIAAGIVPEEQRPAFRGHIENALRLRDNWFPQMVIIALAVGLSLSAAREAVLPGLSTWHSVITPSGPERSLAGRVFDFFSLPVYRIVLFTWLWRYLLWIRFLWRTSRLGLRTMPSHPDQAAGLGFIGAGQTAYGILILAISVSVAGVIAMEVLHGNRSLASFYPLVAAYLALIVLIFLGPLVMFSPTMFRARWVGLYRYSALGAEYTSAFEERWFRPEAVDRKQLLGTPDIQSLADLANAFNVVRKSRIYPFEVTQVALLVTAALLPLLPLLLLEYPLKELLGGIVKLLL